MDCDERITRGKTTFFNNNNIHKTDHKESAGIEFRLTQLYPSVFFTSIEFFSRQNKYRSSGQKAV